MELLLPTTFNLLAASMCIVLGVLVLVRNHQKLTHQTFALLAFNMSLWAVSVVGVIHSKTEQTASFWLHTSEIVVCFFPATFYHFIGYFPKGKFDASPKLLKGLYWLSILLALNTLRPNYLYNIQLAPGTLPRVEHDISMTFMLVAFIFTLVALHLNLKRKYNDAEGFSRRQIQFVMTGSYTIGVFGALVIILESFFNSDSLQAYGPCGTLLLMLPYAYAMFRYHLLDTREFLSKVSVYISSTIFTIAIVLFITAFVTGFTGELTTASYTFSIILSAITISLVFQRVKGFVENLIEVTILNQRYDIDHLYRRIADVAAESTQLDTLLSSISKDIQETVGVKTIRVLLIDSDEPYLLASEYSTIASENPIRSKEHKPLIKYLKANPKPLILEKLLHYNIKQDMMSIVRSLAELEAYFCLPLHTSKGLIGILTLGQKNTQDIYSSEELIAFRALSGPLATAITNAWLFRELERVHRHQTNVFRQMREGVIAVNTKGVVTLINETATLLVGDIKLDNTIKDLHPEIAELLSRTLELEAPISDYEASFNQDNGQTIDVIMSSSSLRTSTGEIEGAIALIYDLTQLKSLEKNVQQADRLSSIGTLAAGMAHEIKNPLVSIKTFTQLLQDRYNDEDFRNTFKDVVPHEVDRINNIVTRLLDFSRSRPISFHPQNIRIIIEEVLALVDNQTRQDNITVELHCPDEDLAVFGDEQQLHQVFLNLVMNAHHAMREEDNPSLTIRITQAYMNPCDKEPRTVFDTQPCVNISLHDNGCGISADDIEELFTPFFTTKDNGCGLGLAVVHGIIAEHRGIIDVSSIHTRGTTFKLSLPKAEEIVATAETSSQDDKMIK
jgi:nitrogen-specific signal transduction histidine kinase